MDWLKEMFGQSRSYSEKQESNTSIELALLEYRNTPISGMDLSPLQLLMSRRLRSNLPMTESLLTPEVDKDAKKTTRKEATKTRTILQ